MTHANDDDGRRTGATETIREKWMSHRRDQETAESPETGGEPTTLGRCTDCGEIYPIQQSEDGLRPVGTDGTCNCDNDRFEPVP